MRSSKYYTAPKIKHIPNQRFFRRANMSTRGRKTGVRGRGANRGQGAAKAGNPVDAILVAMIAELRRELQEQ